MKMRSYLFLSLFVGYLSLSSLAHADQMLLHCAAMNDLHSARMCLDMGVRINAKDRNGLTALHYAAGCGHFAMVAFLLSRGARPSIKDDTPWELTAEQVAASRIQPNTSRCKESAALSN